MKTKNHPGPDHHPYAPGGFMGVMVPYGNFATEWEVSVLLSRPYFAITTRLFEHGDDIKNRLIAYFDPERLSAALKSFGSTPLHAVGVACSATSYMIGRCREQEIFEGLTAQHQQSFSWSTEAIRAALREMGERRFTLVSPYSPDLTEACIAYWQASGYVVEHAEQITGSPNSFHPIYTIAPNTVETAVENALAHAKGPIVITGTGLSTLPAIWNTLSRGTVTPPIISANLALVRHMLALSGNADTSIDAWFTSAATWLEPARIHPRMQEFIHA